MKKIKILIILFFTTLITFTGCKKYEEGPLISMMPKKFRVANKWKVDRMFENSIEISRSAVWESETLEFKTDGGYFYTTALGNTIQGTWDFDSKKENLVVFTSSSIIYKILRLKNKELWLEYTNIPGTRTEIHLVKK